MLPDLPRVLSATEVYLLYGIGRRMLKRLIQEGRVKAVEGLKPLRILDPRWTTLAGLTYRNIEDAPVFRGAEVAGLLNLSPRMIRHMATWGKIPYSRVGNRRCYSLTAVRFALAEKEKGFEGRSNTGVRPWLMEWAKQRL